MHSAFPRFFFIYSRIQTKTYKNNDKAVKFLIVWLGKILLWF